MITPENFPSFSIVINTYCRAEGLRQTLRALLQLDYPNFEIVVVNGPSTDHTVQVLEEFSGRVKTLDCPVRNLSVSRNIGIAAAAGEFVAFIDDDALPEPEWLQHLAAGYDNNRVGATGGKVFDHTGYNFQYQYSTADRLGNAQWQLTEPTPELNFPGSVRFPYLQGTNTSFRRSALIEIGGFDEEFEFYLDETDVCLRMGDAGYIVRQLPAAYVHHKFMPSHIRDENKITRYRYPVVKNKTYFALKNGRQAASLRDIIVDSLKFAISHLEDVEYHITRGSLPETSRQTFAEEIEKALEDGLLHGLMPGRKLITQETLSKFSQAFLPALTREEITRLGDRKTIVLVSKDYPPGQAGGIATFNKDLAVALAALGNNVHVISESHDINRVDFEEGVWVHRLVMRQVALPEIAQQRAIPPHIWYWSAIALEEAQRIASHHKVDVVETPIWDCQGAAFLFQGEWPLVVSLQTSLLFWLESHPELSSDPQWMSSFGTPMLRLERDLLQGCDAARSISAAIRRDIEQTYGITFAEGQAVVAHLGMVDVPVRPVSTMRNKDITILFVGRLEHRKGIDVLLDAVPLVLAETSGVIFRIIGDDTIPGPSGLTFRQQFEMSEAGRLFGNFVRFEGKADDATLLQAYADCDIFTSPSRYESFGLIFLEAMRAEKPVIGCRAGGMPEIIEHEGNGLLVPPGDPVALSQAIIRLATSPKLRDQWGKRGREIFETKFSAERMAINSKVVFETARARHNNKNSFAVANEKSQQPQSQIKISFITGICIENDAISNAVFDEIEALRSHGLDNIRLYTYQCTQKGLPYRHVESLAEIALDPHFQESRLVIFHFGVYYPLFNLLPLIPKTAKKLVVFHNITPKEFVSKDLHETIDKSFTQLSNILWADHVACDSATNLKALRDAGIFTPASVLPLSANISAHPLARKPSFDDQVVRIIFIGRFSRSKGPHELIEALSGIVLTNPEIRIELNLIGNLAISEGTLVEQLRQNLAGLERNFSGRIVARLHGNASNVQKEELLRQADLFVLPTRHEGFCVPILEAFACGCRVIVYENSNTPAISGGLSTLVPTGNVALLSQAILNDIQLIFSGQWRGSGVESYTAYASRTCEYVAKYSPEITKARFIRFVVEWLDKGQVAREFLSDFFSDNFKLPVKNVPIVSASYLLDRPQFVEKLTSRILLGESEPCLGEGWLSPENWPPRLRHFGKHARIFLKSPPGSQPRLEIKAFCSNKNLSHDPVTLTVSLWGQPIGSYVFEQEGWTTLSIWLPEDSNHPFLNLELSVDKTWMPDTFNHDGDTRELGLAVETIAITTTKNEKPDLKPETDLLAASKRRKKIVFWQPDSQATYGMNLGVYPPVGLLILASIARNKGFEVAFVDSENEKLSLDDTARVLKTHEPDVLAFTMPTPYVRIYNQQLPLLRRELPNTIFITGGPHPSARKEQIFIDVPLIDVAVYGEGEIAFTKLLDHILCEIPVHQIPSLIYRDTDGVVSLTDKAPPILDLDSIPFPAYDLVQHLIGIYPATFPSRTKPSIHIMATRGCPFHCTYCSNAVFGASIRMRSPEHVVREIEYLVDQLGVRELFFQDDTLNCSPEYFLKMCDLLIEKNLNKKAMFKVVFRANKNLVTSELLAKAKEAGVWMIFYGVESGDPRMLQRINKGITLDELKRAFLLTRQAGIKSHASLMIGNPGEDKESIAQSYDLLTELLPDTFCFSIAYPFPGTHFYDEVIEKGLMYPHTDFVDEHYPWTGISRTEVLSRDEIYQEKESIQQKTVDFFMSDEGLHRIRNQYASAGRDDLWEENIYYHENPVLWADYDILNADTVLSYGFLQEKLACQVLPGKSDYGLGEGWLSAECWPPNLRHFRKRARVFLKKPASSRAVLTIKAFSGYLEIQNDPIEFTVSVWGNVIGRHLFYKNEWTTVSIELSVDDIDKPFINLEFSVNKTWVPDRFKRDGDIRELGLAVESIEIATKKKQTLSTGDQSTSQSRMDTRIKKIVFWVPESYTTYKLNFGGYAPLGLLILATIARDKGFKVAFVDSENENLSMEDTIRTLKSHNPDVLAFSMPTPYVRIFNRQLPELRKALPTTFFVSGGPHPSARREHIFDDVPLIDAAIYGEGELAFSKFLDYLQGDTHITQVPSLIFKDNDGRPATTASAPPILNLDTIPFPAYDLVQHLINSYPATFPSCAKPSMSVMATRGCPYQCTYCSNAVFGTSIRMRSVEHVIREVEYLVNCLDVKEVFFQDDTLNCSPDYFVSICNLLISKGLNKKAMFKVVFRANRNLVTPELLAKAKEAGIWIIYYGVESGDPEMLRRIKKGITLDELKRAFLLTRQAGIKSRGMLMIGNPGEDRDSINKSYELITELMPDTFCFSIAYPFPGTCFYDQVIEQGLMYEHHDFVAEHYPWIGISRTEALNREEIALEKEIFEQKTLDFFQSEQGLKRIHAQYSAVGRENLWGENLYHHENPVLWADYAILNADTVLSYDFLQEKLACQVLPGKSDYGLGEGWLSAECWPPILRHFRKRARVFLKKPDSVKATLIIKAFSGYLNIQNDPIIFSISVWGKPIHSMTFTKHEWITVTTELSMDEISELFVCLEFSVDKTWCPHTFLNDGDRRELGLAISEISIIPARNQP